MSMESGPLTRVFLVDPLTFPPGLADNISPTECAADGAEEAWGPAGADMLPGIAEQAGPRRTVDRRTGETVMRLSCRNCGADLDARFKQGFVARITYLVSLDSLPVDCPLWWCI